MKKLVLAGLLSIGVAFATDVFEFMGEQANTLAIVCDTQNCKNFIAESKEVNEWMRKAEQENKDDKESKIKHMYYTTSGLQAAKKACASFRKLNNKDINALTKKISVSEDLETKDLEYAIMKGCIKAENPFLYAFNKNPLSP